MGKLGFGRFLKIKSVWDHDFKLVRARFSDPGHGRVPTQARPGVVRCPADLQAGDNTSPGGGGGGALRY